MSRDRLIPLIIAVALFMENMDSTTIATSPPAIAALIGPIIGPPVGGFISTYASWHWIFIINVPIGLIGILLATRYIEDVRVEGLERFDLVGMVLAGLGVAGPAFGLSVAGLGLVPTWLIIALVAAGAASMAAYVAHRGTTPS